MDNFFFQMIYLYAFLHKHMENFTETETEVLKHM